MLCIISQKNGVRKMNARGESFVRLSFCPHFSDCFGPERGVKPRLQGCRLYASLRRVAEAADYHFAQDFLLLLARAADEFLEGAHQVELVVD